MNEPHRDFPNPATAMAEMTDIVVDQIRKLAELREAGALTEEEFAAKKSELLARI
jgi:hypothetical protein